MKVLVLPNPTDEKVKPPSRRKVPFWSASPGQSLIRLSDYLFFCGVDTCFWLEVTVTWLLNVESSTNSTCALTRSLGWSKQRHPRTFSFFSAPWVRLPISLLWHLDTRATYLLGQVWLYILFLSWLISVRWWLSSCLRSLVIQSTKSCERTRSRSVFYYLRETNGLGTTWCVDGSWTEGMIRAWSAKMCPEWFGIDI